MSARALKSRAEERCRSARRWGAHRLIAAGLGLFLIALGFYGQLTPAQAVGTIHAPITGGGSTWSANALQQWIRNVYANYQWTIRYEETGSTVGRNGFAAGTVDFGVSEIPYLNPASFENDNMPERAFVYMPIVAGGTVFMYNLEIGGQRVTNLRLSGEAVAKIFTNQIKVWNHPEIQADNPGLALPATPIVPIVRSDGSGTSAQFTTWMRQRHAPIWDAYCGAVGRHLVGGHCGVTSNYPTIPGSGFIGRSGGQGVAGAVAQAHAVGSITYVEYSYALNSRFPVVKLLNEGGYFTEPTAPNVAVALLSAQINQDRGSQNYLTQDLTQVFTSPDIRTYPLSSYSYIIMPTQLDRGFTEDKGRTLADFGSYFLCEGQQQADALGYSPLPINLVAAGQEQIRKIPGGDPVIKDITACNNPTFSPDGTNRLANEAPYPPDCDRRGPVQCTTGTGGTRGTETRPTAGAGAGGADGAGSGAAGEAGGAGALGAGAAVDGDVLSADAAPALVSGSPQDIPASHPGALRALGLAGAGAGMLAAAVLPPLLGRRLRGGVALRTRPSPNHSSNSRREA
ncbi:phosphate ABC transporter substrate-binding protein PstS [Leucobacter luti]|uniref:phosphate ABC transporter substrate-binding protein PstS n=1 Tax=Leucobacter luti TaxID=340320 RepID=UPI003D06DECE